MRDKFTQEEANEILLRAVEKQPVGREMTREQLESLAAEIGISADALHAAEDSWRVEHLEEEDERRLFYAHQQERGRGIMRFAAHLSVFMFFFIMMIFVGMEDDDAVIPFLAILIPWSIWLAFYGVRTFQSRVDKHEKAFREWQQARRMEERGGRDPLGPASRRLIR